MQKPTETPVAPRQETAPTGSQSGKSRSQPTLDFFFDPICPWAWRTASWIRDVQRQIPIDVHWKFFSLAIANGRNDPALLVPLRVCALVREQAGNAGVERLYFALGQLIHEEGADVHACGAMNAVAERALEQTGFSRDMLQRATNDPATERKVIEEYTDAKTRYGAYGVPWLVVGDGDFGFQGPVIQPVPTGETAVDMWHHVSWLLGQSYFYELKRSR